MMQRFSSLAAALFLFISAALSVGVRWWQYSTSRAEIYGTAIEEAVRPLRLERQVLEEELQELECTLDRQTLGDGVGVAVFLELPEAVYTEAYPILREQSFPAVLALSETQYPGAPDCITVEQFQQLRAAGWITCLSWDGFSDLSALCAHMKALLTPLNEPLPTVIRIAPESFRAGLREELEAAGFTILMVHGEEQANLITRQDEGTLWELNAIPWNRLGIKSFVMESIRLGGCFTLEIDFSSEERCFDAELFQYMCQFFSEQEHYAVMTPDNARSYRKTLEQDKATVAAIEWHKSEIAQINREIDAIYRNN